MTRTIRLAARQALLEQRSFWRSAEYALFTFAFPLMILLLIGAANVGARLPGTHIKNTTVFVPGILAFGVIVAAYVNLGSKVAVMRTAVATVLTSRPPMYAPDGNGVVLIRLSTPSWRSTATLDPRFT